MLPSVLGWGAPDGGAASAAGSAPPSDPGATNAGASSRVSTRPAHVHINLSAPTPAPRARGTSEHPGDANPGESATPASPDGTHPDGTDPDVTTSPTTRTTPAPGGATSRQGATQRPAATPPPGGHGLPGPADHDPRTTSAGLDWNTETPDELDYTPVFEPAITPWKRVVALERVTGAGTGYALQPSAGPTRLVRPGEPAGRGERSFRGRLALAAAPGRWQPLPSVAPDQRYVYAVSTPRATTDLAVDDHGNHFVRSSSTVPFELIVEVAVDARYFADPSDADPSDADRATGASVATGTGAALGTSGARPPAPPEVPELLRTDARVVARWLGIAEDAPPRTIVAQLAAWFRGFEPGAFPADARSDRPLFDIVMTRVGACRHRALAFTMIAQGLGVPTRYVQNEAHAFVEVRLGDAGWQRLDLGGAPARLRLQDVTPPRAGAVSGDDAAPAQATSLSFTASRVGAGADGGAGADVGAGADGGGVGGDRATVGSRWVVAGQLRGGDGPLAARRVTIELIQGAPDRPSAVTTLGVATTGADGRFEATVKVPAAVPPGPSTLIARFAGEPGYEPGTSADRRP